MTDPRTNLPTENYFAVLGVECWATDAEVRRRYLELVRAHPPEQDPEAFKRIQGAYDVIKTEDDRVRTAILTPSEAPLAAGPFSLNDDATGAIRDALALIRLIDTGSDIGKAALTLDDLAPEGASNTSKP